MDSERWRRVEELYHAALAHPADLRPAFLQAACQGDDSLWREIRSLLDQGDGTWPQRATIAHPDLPTPALIGRRIGSYEVQGLLGAGGMGEVYRARDSRLGREVAIKILPREWVTDSDRVVRLEREARALASLNHPNIATIHGIEETDGSRALILELIEGPTLADRIARGPLPVAEALAIARQIVDGLE